jgi:hypothetical protein
LKSWSSESQSLSAIHHLSFSVFSLIFETFHSFNLNVSSEYKSSGFDCAIKRGHMIEIRILVLSMNSVKECQVLFDIVL